MEPELELFDETASLDKHFNAAVSNIPLAHLELQSLDRLIGSIRPAQLTVIAGAPGASKTTLISQIGDDLAAQGNPVLFFSFELLGSQLLAKSLARLGDGAFSLGEIPGLQNDPLRKKCLYEALEKYRATIAPHTFLMDKKGYNTFEIGAYASACERLTQKKPVILLDYIQIIKSESDTYFTDERTAIKQAIVGLRRVANLHQVPIIAISSINRSNYDSSSANLSALGGCSFIEYSADVVLNMTVAGKDKSERSANLTLTKRPVTITALKNRFGPMGETTLLLDTEHARFSEWE